MSLASYRALATTIPAGQTWSFVELARALGRPGGARAAARALGEAAWAEPWHRVTYAKGGLAHDPDRRAEQIARLRLENARPHADEGINSWATRVGARWVVDLRHGRAHPVGDGLPGRLDPLRVEAIVDSRSRAARGFLLPGESRALPPPLPSQLGPREGQVDPELSARLMSQDWGEAAQALREDGLVRLPRVLTPGGCRALLGASAHGDAIHHTRDMEPRGLGRGSYHVWNDPMPEPASSLLAGVYRQLTPHLGIWPQDRPPELVDFHRLCRTKGQTHNANILLAYGPNGCNHPHRDIYGPVVHPVQGVVLLSQRGDHYEGGDFAMWEGTDPQPARRCAAELGDLILFAAQTRRPEGRRVVQLRHGMTPVTRGIRYAFGMVFHLAR